MVADLFVKEEYTVVLDKKKKNISCLSLDTHCIAPECLKSFVFAC